MTDQPSDPSAQLREAEPPEGGRQDHASMHVAAQRPVSGPAATDDLAASGGLEVPGRDSDESARLARETAPADREERIPGEREADTLTHREPGAMGGRSTGEDLQSDPGWLDETTAIEHAREGGGGSVAAAKRRLARSVPGSTHRGS